MVIRTEQRDPIQWDILAAWVIAWIGGVLVAGVGLVWILGVLALVWHVIGWVTQ